MRPLSSERAVPVPCKINEVKTKTNRNHDSRWSSPAIVVRKPHGAGFRLCVDLRAVNAITESSAWPMPMLEVVLGKLQGSKCFATLDMNQGYWQFPLDKGSQEICSFMTDEGVFSPE